MSAAPDARLTCTLAKVRGGHLLRGQNQTHGGRDDSDGTDAQADRLG